MLANPEFINLYQVSTLAEKMILRSVTNIFYYIRHSPCNHTLSPMLNFSCPLLSILPSCLNFLLHSSSFDLCLSSQLTHRNPSIEYNLHESGDFILFFAISHSRGSRNNHTGHLECVRHQPQHYRCGAE